MLSDFITQNRSEILKRSRARVANRSAPRPTDEELENGIPPSARAERSRHVPPQPPLS